MASLGPFTSIADAPAFDIASLDRVGADLRVRCYSADPGVGWPRLRWRPPWR